MNERDLSRVLTEYVADVHLPYEAVRKIRMAVKEENPVKKKSLVLVLVLMLVLAASVAFALDNGMFDFLSRMMGQQVLPGATELVQTDVAYGETEDAAFAIRQAVYDGNCVSLLVEIRAKDDQTFLMGQGWSPDDKISWYNHFTQGVSPNESRTIAQYAADNGYTRFANVSLEIFAGDCAGIEEWNNNVLTVLYSFNAAGEELHLPIEYFSRTYTCDGDYHMDEPQRMPDGISLKASAPMWTVSSSESFDAPDFGVRVDGITVVGTPVQSYYALSYTVIDAEKARSFGWNTNVMDMNHAYLPRGVLGVGGSPLPTENGQQIVDNGSFAAMETPPAQLTILLRSWDDEVLNCYFPVTLR